jgi:hypothetical protein
MLKKNMSIMHTAQVTDAGSTNHNGLQYHQEWYHNHGTICTLYCFYSFVCLYVSYAVAYWLRHYPASRKVAGSSPHEVDFFKLT